MSPTTLSFDSFRQMSASIEKWHNCNSTEVERPVSTEISSIFNLNAFTARPIHFTFNECENDTSALYRYWASLTFKRQSFQFNINVSVDLISSCCCCAWFKSPETHIRFSNYEVSNLCCLFVPSAHDQPNVFLVHKIQCSKAEKENIHAKFICWK